MVYHGLQTHAKGIVRESDVYGDSIILVDYKQLYSDGSDDSLTFGYSNLCRLVGNSSNSSESSYTNCISKYISTINMGGFSFKVD